jgi:hypothetical protein
MSKVNPYMPLYSFNTNSCSRHHIRTDSKEETQPNRNEYHNIIIRMVMFDLRLFSTLAGKKKYVLKQTNALQA